MKPSFALSLSFEGIGLLHRSFPGWNRVGEVALDSPDLTGALAVLRDTARQINGKELTSKLVIPNDQIKYLSLDLGMADEAARDAAIRKALDGVTPYPVDDLVFDWSVENGKTLVAAVARETLAEAEQFASDHGFGPMSFVAIPPEGQFSGEPFFGPTRHAGTVLAAGEAVQRDMAPIRVTGVARLPETEDPPEDGATGLEAGADVHGDDVPASGDLPEAAGDVAEDAAEAEGKDADAPPEESAAPEAEPPPEESAAPEALPEAHTAEAALDATAEPAQMPAPEEERAPDPAPATAAEETAEEDDTAPEAPAQAEASDDSAPARDTLPAFTTIRARRGDPEPAEAVPFLAGVRRWSDDPVADDLIAPSIPISTDEDAFPPAPPIAATPGATEAPEDRPDGWPEDRPEDRPEDWPEDWPAMAGEPAPATAEAAPGFPPLPDDLRDEPAAHAAAPEAAPRESRLAFFSRRGAGMATGLASGIGASLAARSARRAEARAQAEAAAAHVPEDLPEALPGADGAGTASERERMTVFGARRREAGTQAAVGGKPRYLGLILTAVLLIFLAGVAAWASIFVDEGLSRFFAPRDTAVARLPDDTTDTTDTTDEMSVEGDEAMVPSLPDSPPEPAGPQIETAALTTRTDETATPPARAEPEPPRALTPQEAQARYAVTGVWLRAPEAPPEPEQATLEDLYVASIDPRVEEHDAVALPDLATLRPDDMIAQVASPAARGSSFDLDARGLVVASAAGTLSPEGFLVFAGRPELTPGPVPERTEPEPEATQESVERALLAAFRPKPRPEGLVEENERQNLGGITWAEVARVRPRPRPELDIAKIEEEADETGTAQAVDESRKPALRPRDFARVVERAQDAEPEPEPTRVAAAVPRQQAVAPSIPSQSNVAKAATVRNQLNLRKVNLIGVYGKPNARRALVRLSNGRYQKVEVGDRLDGGRVQAIGETELRYRKNGRNVILQMPRG